MRARTFRNFVAASSLCLASTVALHPAAARGGGSMDCGPAWRPTFGAAPGIPSGEVRSFTVFDDGEGPALFAGGTFGSVSGTFASRVARWDGASWSNVGNGLGGFYAGVSALAVYDDGAGPALYATGDFTGAGGGHIARRDGGTWAPLGQGLAGIGGIALAVFDDGTTGGPVLYVGGNFLQAGDQAADNIARWDGHQWSPVGLGVSGAVQALAVHDDGLGGGPALYAAGTLGTSGGVGLFHVARWNGSQWTPLGNGTAGNIFALASHDDGSGPALYAGGTFQSAGGQPAAHIARWDGTSWAPVGSGANDAVVALHVHHPGGGAPPLLYAGGSFTTAGGQYAPGIARWDGSAWSPVSVGAGGTVHAITSFDDGSGAGSRVHAGGDFITAGNVDVRGLAVLSHDQWLPLGSGLDDPVEVLATCTVGSSGTPALYAGGSFAAAGGVLTRWIGRWDGAGWSPLGDGLDGWVRALAQHDDGSGAGPALYAGGAFSDSGGVPLSRIGRWDGTSWSALDSGVGGTVWALRTFDDGTGDALYAGGQFSTAGGLTVNRVAKWDGSQWSALSGGVSSTVRALEVYDDGQGPALYVAGLFPYAGGQPVGAIARWDGAAWSALAGGVSGGAVHSLAVYDDGSGPRLCAGGTFTSAGGVPVQRVAAWDGTSWAPLGAGLDGDVLALTVQEDEDGGAPTLVAAGEFLLSGGTLVARMARWDGSAWSPIGSGADDTVRALAVFDDGSGASLYAGGDFLKALDSGDSYLARHGPCAMPGRAFCRGDGSAFPCPCANEDPEGGGCANSSGAGADLLGEGGTSVAADDLVFQASQLLSGQPALLFVGDNAVNGGDGAPFGDGLRCAGGGVRRLGVSSPDASGAAAWGPGLSGPGSFEPGTTQRFQVWYRDPTGSPCGYGFNLSNGYELTFTR